MIYFDSAYVAKCYLNEPGAETVRAFARAQDGLCSCEIARIEVVATFHRHVREGRLRPIHIRKVLARFEADQHERVWTWLAVTSELVGATCAALHALPATVYVRSADALHLACAREHGIDEVYTNDRHMLAAAPHFRVAPRNLLG